MSLISNVNVEDEMKQSYVDYAMSVIIGRALPDVRDGLKPVQRRILYAMMREGLASNRKHSKCAGVVGEVLKRLHPHGDIPVYDALARLAQTWSLRYPLIDGQGNFGSIDGDPPAAYRYTECRMSSFTEKLLEDLEKDTVDTVANFDDSIQEPLVLPSAVPNLLVNGSDGIAVGMATHIPPHNLKEVVEGTLALLANPQITVAEMMKHIPGPDFPTGGVLYGRSALISAYTSGRGVIKIRAKAHFEKLKSEKREIDAVVVTEIPFQVNKSRLLERIGELHNSKEIEGISKLRDESDREGMRIVIEVKRDATPEIVLNQLYAMTPMQESFGIINLAIVEGRPVVCSLIELLKHFLNHRREVVTRRTQFDLKKAQDRMHILEGLRIVLLNIDEVIAIIKKSQTGLEARLALTARFGISEIQSQSILDLRLQKLTGLERLAVEKEHEELAKEIERLLLILSDSKRVDEILAQELRAVNEQFGDPRRTEIVEEAVGAIEAAAMIEDEEMVVSVTHRGYIKRTAVTEYRAQKRGGKGVSGASSSDEEDYVEHLFVTSTLATMMIFTTEGRAFWLKVYEVPESGRATKGRALVNLLELREGEGVAAIIPIRTLEEQGGFVFLATKQGVVKKMEFAEFRKSNRNGIIACSLNEGDSLIGAALTTGVDDVMLITKSGMSIRFSEDDVRAMGRTARGVGGVTLTDNDLVVSACVIAKTPTQATDVSDKDMLLSVCELGYGKRTPLEEYRVQGRNGKGVIDIQTEDRNGPVVSAVPVKEASGVMIITTSGKIIRMNASDLSPRGRNTKGVRLINLDEGEKVVAATIVAEEDESGTATKPVEQ